MAEKPGDLPEAKEKETVEHSTADYHKYPQPEKPIRNWTRIFSIFIAVLLLAGAGTGAYWYLKNHKSTPAKSAQTGQTTAPAKTVAATKSYTSPNFYLTFSYPASWTIIDNGGGTMTVTSADMQLKDVAGSSVNGKIVMTILNGSKQLPGFTAGSNATAVLASQKITYTKPTQTQRADTYITFISYSTTTASNGLDAIYISGNNGYTKAQAVPLADLLQVNPIISLSFTNSSGKALTLAASDWNDSSFSAPLLSMLKSLAIT